MRVICSSQRRRISIVSPTYTNAPSLDFGTRPRVTTYRTAPPHRRSQPKVHGSEPKCCNKNLAHRVSRASRRISQTLPETRIKVTQNSLKTVVRQVHAKNINAKTSRPAAATAAIRGRLAADSSSSHCGASTMSRALNRASTLGRSGIMVRLSSPKFNALAIFSNDFQAFVVRLGGLVRRSVNLRK